MDGAIGVAVVGYGYWGPNLVRNFSLSANARIAVICDEQPARAARAAREHPGVRVVTEFEDVLADPAVDLVACATPVTSHYRLGKAALQAGKHVLLEKPMTKTSAEALELLEIAAKAQRRIFVDHTFVFTPAVQRMKAMYAAGDLGSLYYYDSTRINLGLFQRDVDVVWDLAPHDLSILDFLLDGQLPERLSCISVKRFGPLADQAYVSLSYAGGFFAHVHVNWVSPVKSRQVLLCADKKMVVYDDLALEKVRVYDRGVSFTSSENPYAHMVSYRDGDMWAPRLESREALSVEVSNVLGSLLGAAEPIVDGYLGYRVVRLLELIDESMKNDGAPITIDATSFQPESASV